MNETSDKSKHIAILGGGPGGLFMFKRSVEANTTDFKISIFERKNDLGGGMPYSHEGACDEHITNVSANEIPELVTSVSDWIKTVPKDTLIKYKVNIQDFNDYKVLPRLLFGQYLNAQFSLLQKIAKDKGIEYEIHYKSEVTDIIDVPCQDFVEVEVNGQERFKFNHVVICTGHSWPKRNEGTVPGYFDSPYPPAKLALKVNHAVAIKGSSLTAVDAIRTLAKHNGTFHRSEDGKLSYITAEGSENFKMVMHTRNGMLPAVRFHLEDSHLQNSSLLTKDQIAEHIESNDGFLSLDYIFEKDFVAPIREKDSEFYEKIKLLKLEEFVAAMMDLRERLDAFQLMRAEYKEAEKSIRRKQSIYWKEMLGVLSFALNYPAKHLSAEDMVRLKTTLSPLISVVIAYIPQSSAEQLLALNDAGVLDLIPVGQESFVATNPAGGIIYHYKTENTKMELPYQTYVDAVGQPQIDFEDFPFKSLISNETVSRGLLKFKSVEAAEKAMEEGKTVTKTSEGNYYLKVPGIAINDYFQILDQYGAANPRIYIMAVPYIGGYNPDYSGLDFSEAASAEIIASITSTLKL